MLPSVVERSLPCPTRRIYEIRICDVDGDTFTGDSGCQFLSRRSGAGFPRASRDRLGGTGYCRHHSATKVIGRIYEIRILDGTGNTFAGDGEC